MGGGVSSRGPEAGNIATAGSDSKDGPAATSGTLNTPNRVENSGRPFLICLAILCLPSARRGRVLLQSFGGVMLDQSW